MSWYERCRNVFRTEQLEEEIDCELQFHLTETADRLVAEGMPEEEAARQARLRLGNYCGQKERTRDMNIAGWLDSMRADLIYAFRQVRWNPGFAAVAVLSLALGIGANTATFQLVDAFAFRMLPVQNPEELATIGYQKGAARIGWFSSRSANFTYAQWLHIREAQEAFSGVFAWSAARFNLTTGGEPRFAEGMYVSGNFFKELGVPALVGRTLTAADDGAECQDGAVLSYPFWQREFGGSPDVLQRTVSLDGHAVPVLGVTGAGFSGVEVGNRYDLAVPLCADRRLSEAGQVRMDGASRWWLSVMGRLKPGWTIERATAQLQAISPGVMQATLPPTYTPDFAKRFLANRLKATEGSTGISGLRRQYEGAMLLLAATAGLVLLIACANLANLLLARATAREGEMAVRLALGATRARLVRQLLTESLLLAGAGAMLGAGLAVVVSRSLVAFLNTPQDPVAIDLSLDGRVLAFAAGSALLTCAMFGLLPALRATFLAPAAAMRAGGRSVTAGRDRFSARRILVATQVALSLVLLVGALLFVQTLHNLMTVDPGFQQEGVLVANIDFRRASYPKEQRPAVLRELQERLSALPGVISVAQTGMTPVSDSSWDQLVGPDAARAEGSGRVSFFNRVSPGYFRTMGTRLLAGREFTEQDTLSSVPVAIVNEEFARRYFDGKNPVGHTFHLDADAGKPEPVFQIVAWVANTKYRQLREEFRPIAYFPIAQEASPGTSANFVLRTAGATGPLVQSGTNAVTAMSPQIGVTFQPFSVQLQNSLLRERLMASLSGGFGLLAGLLAALGLYGVLAYMVSRRQAEIGVRIALGADRASVIRLVLREALLLVGVGLAAGAGMALWAGRAASTLLFGLKPYDAATLAAAGALLAGIALLASYVPARRAAGLNPLITLRSE